MNLNFYFTQKISLKEKVLRMYQITSRFMQQESFRSKGHSGIDFYMEEGTPLRSIRDGYIEKIVDYGNQNVGKGIFVKWEDGKTAIYGHLSKFSTFKEGEFVQKGDLLGYSGHSGNVVGKTGNHLHFGLKENGHFIDPSPYINDIQNMNINVVQKVVEIKLNFLDYMNQHMNVLSDLKLHLINLSDNTLLIQIGKQLLQFITIHSGLLNHIIACIF
jgi:Peptidase family M23